MPCAPEATRPDSRTTLPYVHTTETWAPSRAAVSHTHHTASAGHHGGEGVVGGFAAVRRLSRLRWRLLGIATVIHPRLAALGVPSEVRGPSGIVNTSWDRLPAFCMWDLLFCVLCRCRTFYTSTVDCRPPTLSPASAPPCHLRASADHRAQRGTTSGQRTNNSTS